MRQNSETQKNPVADRLRPVVYLYAALNIAVATLLFGTVTPSVATGPSQDIASLR